MTDESNAPCCGLWAAAIKARDEWRARSMAADAALAEMTRRRDEWRKKADGYDELANAVRAGIEAAGDRNLSRVFLRGALVDSERRLKEAEAALARMQLRTAADQERG